MKSRRKLGALGAAVWLAALCSPPQAQEQDEVSPTAALAAAMVGACRHDEQRFARYLTDSNAEVFLQLPPSYRRELMKRFMLLDQPGRPLLSRDTRGSTIPMCETPGVTGELRLGRERIEENLAFISVDTGGRQIEMGMVREGGGWRIVSVGLLLIHMPELARQWAAQELEQKEAAAIGVLRDLAEAIQRYRRAFGALPETLAQLGPAPAEGVSPDAAGLIDAELAAGSKAGYRFRYRIVPATPAGESGFELAAVPAEYPRTGRRSFFLDAAGTLRGADKQGAVATPADPPISRPQP